MNGIKNLTVIIPVGPEEDAWKRLLTDLHVLPEDADIIIASAMDCPGDIRVISESEGFKCTVRWIKIPKGRARQLNAGARAAVGKTLWFVHADSMVTPNAIYMLHKSLERNIDAIHYFNLSFSKDGPAFMRLNTAGAWIRSRILGLPFGDQGFCVPKAVFVNLGGFDEHAPYGEDHLFIWKARQAGIRVVCTGGWLETSSRKYSREGWSTTTVRHAVLTAKQAVPEFLHLIKEKVIP